MLAVVAILLLFKAHVPVLTTVYLIPAQSCTDKTEPCFPNRTFI